MIILDTNVASALMRPEQSPSVVAWADQQRWETVWTTVVNLLEARVGILLLPKGKRRDRLESGLETILSDRLSDRVLTFDRAAAEQAARLSADRLRRGFNVDAPDTQIAGIALAHAATLATRNTRHFQDTGLKLVNPWSQQA